MNAVNRLGFVSASALLIVGIAYAFVVGIGIADAGLSEPIVDPILGIMELLTLLSAPLIVMLLASVHAIAESRRKIWGVIALVFGSMMAGITSSVHFAMLTAGRKTGYTTLEWPSMLYAVELLAWDVFLGLGLVFAAQVFAGPGLTAAARWMLRVTGGLCLAGAAGPLSGWMPAQWIATAGYGLVLPFTWLVLALFFRRRSSADA